MIRISALNESESGGNESLSEATTKEAKEAEVFAWYNRALVLQKQGNIFGAESTFQHIIDHSFLIEVKKLVENEVDGVVHPGLPLLYSVHKNLAGIAMNRNDEKTALHHYLEAVKVDESEVTVWYKIGKIALNIHNYSLAKLAFEQGLECNPNHWLCLDKIITITYAYNNYWNCLEFIAHALEKDCNYMKAIAIREQIFKEQADLKPLAKRLFLYCDPVIFRIKVDKTEADEYVNEAVAIRNKRRELAKEPPPPVIKLPEKIDKFTWKRVGECFLALYNMAMHQSECSSLCRPVDISEYDNIMEQPMETEDIKDGEAEVDTNNSVEDGKTDEPETKSKIETGESNTDKTLNKFQDSKVNIVNDENIVSEEKIPNDEAIPSEVKTIGAEKPKTTETKYEVDASTTESSQESDMETAEVTSQSSSESVVLIENESELNTSQKSIGLLFASSAAVTETQSADSVTASTITESQTLSQTSSVPLSASDILAQVAAKVAAEVSGPSSTTQTVLSVSQVSSTTNQLSEAPVNLSEEQSDCIVVEVTADEQVHPSTDEPSTNPVPPSSSEAQAPPEASCILGQTDEGTVPAKNKTSILASMIVGDFLPADDLVQDFDYESLFKDHNHAKPDTPTSRNDRGQKRKRLYLDDRYGNKRRSARVKNTKEQKQEENVNFQELLQKFLPSSLIKNTDDDDDEMRSDEAETEKVPITQVDQKDVEVKKEIVILLKDGEDNDVRNFIQSCLKNQGIIHLCSKYLKTLAHQDYKKWPEGLTKTFLDLFKATRPNLTFPNLFSDDLSMDTKYDFSKIGLVGCELLLDEYIKLHESSDKEILSRGEMENIFGKYLREDLWYILFCIGFPTVIKENPTSYCVRVHWLRGRYYLLQDNIEEAVVCFEQTLFYLKELNEKEQKSFVKLHNCKSDQFIIPEKVGNRKENVQRTHSLDQTQKQFENENYDKVIESLLKTFENSINQMPQSCISPCERHSQIQLLQKALFKHGNMQKCVLWGEVCFNEALYYYRKAPTPIHREKWVKTMTEVLASLNKAFEKDISACKDMPSVNKIRFCQNLMKVLETMMDVSPNVVDMPIGTVIPWIILYRLIHYEEIKLHSMIASQSAGQAQVLEGAISSSLMLLSVAHEYLGRHSWCTKNNGAVLLLFLKVLRRESRKTKLSSSLKEELDLAFEQCVYCLYGHPNKKTKTRRLQDHNSQPISLTWIRAQPVFEYFKPATVPEFDSYKTSTVSAELEGLLRRVFVLVPEELGGVARVDSVLKYIEGEINTPPTYETENSVLKELYYLLADYYFKNKETSKATRFYQYDLCVNPTRLDSWAGTSLARMSQLEQKLNAMELKLDTPVHKKSISALRCFKRAVEINDSTRTLWIEYGSLAYQLHSHSSRQLKLKNWFPLDEEFLQIVTDTKPEMLQIAHNCYWKASECEADGSEEEWLHHYMMGKVKEKKGVHPKDYLEHYRQAAIYLHEDEAMYPKRIVFSHSPPHLAIEALEVFFRLHAAILKHLLKDDGIHDYPLYEHYITEAAASPFAKAREKRQERRESTNEDNSSSNSAYSQSNQKPVYHMTPQDHTYSKQKGRSSGGSESDNSSLSVNELKQPCSSAQSKDIEEDKKSNTEKTSQITKQVTEPFKPSIEVVSETSVNKDSLKPSNTVKIGDKTDNIESVDVMDTIQCKDVNENEHNECAPKIENKMDVDTNCKSDAKLDTVDITCEELSEVSDKPSASHPDSAKAEDTDMGSATSHQKIADDDTLQKDDSVIDLTASDDEVPEKKIKNDNNCHGNESHDQQNKDSSDTKKISENEKISEKSDKDTLIVIDSNSELSDINGSKNIKKSTEDKPEDNLKDKTSKDPETVREELIKKCMNTLQLCLSRFPNHYKSVYRLAHAYTTSRYHKNLQFARDILLGTSRWQQTAHMSTPGLFHERKTANFFQGIWKIPVQEIDRAGSFASHMNRSICLLLDILKGLQDNRMLYNIHVQLLRVPDTGRKFLRDAERTYLWKQAFRYTIDVLLMRCECLEKENNEDKRLSFLMDVYKVWHHGIHKLNKFVDSTNKMFIKTYRMAQKDKVNSNLPIIEQASKFCQHRQTQLSSRLPQIPSVRPTISVSKSQDSQSDSSLFSPTRSDGQSVFFSPPPKKLLTQGSCMSPIPNSPSTPSGASTKFSSPSTPKSSVGSSLTSSPITSKPPGYLSDYLNIKKAETPILTPPTPKITTTLSNTKPETTKPVHRIISVSSSTPSNPVSKKTVTSMSSAIPKSFVPKITKSSTINQPTSIKPVSVNPSAPKTIAKMQVSSSSVIPKHLTSVPAQKNLIKKQIIGSASLVPAPKNPLKKSVIESASSQQQKIPVQSKQTVGANLSSSVSKPQTSNKKPQQNSQAKACSEEVVETLIEAHEEDEFLILSNPDELIQSFLGYHNL